MMIPFVSMIAKYRENANKNKNQQYEEVEKVF